RTVAGMSRLLSRGDAPVIFLETNGLFLPNYGETPNGLIRRLEEFGYTCHRIEGQTFRPCRWTDLHPEAWTDMVAMKPAHAARVAPRIGPPLSEAEWVRKRVYEGTVAEPAQRAYIARTLREARPEFQSLAEIRALLDALARDPDES